VLDQMTCTLHSFIVRQSNDTVIRNYGSIFIGGVFFINLYAQSTRKRILNLYIVSYILYIYYNKILQNVT